VTTTLAAAALVVAFAALARALRLVERSRRVLPAVRGMLADLRDASLSEDARERAMRAHALRLLRMSVGLMLAGAGCLLLPLGVLWLSERAGLVEFRAVTDRALSWPFVVAAAFLLAAVVAATRATASAGFENRYSTLDRMLHRLAFSTSTAQLALAELEQKLFRKELAAVDGARPVFVTALPRAGTTLLLELCVGSGELAAHTYRDMPFVLMPLLWARFARRFQVTDERRERAHGDGMLVGVDSPEAFDEVVWRAFWRRHYLADRIQPWGPGDRDDEFLEFLRAHARKIVAARRAAAGPHVSRYVSKNNLNIARLELIRRCFPDAIVILPFRDPLQHAISLCRQHENFTRIHASDRFAARYMRDVGHYDFGANLRPVDFGGWLDSRRCADPQQLDFWLEYWCVAHRALLSHPEEPGTHFLSYDALCREPHAGMEQLAGLLGLRERAAFLEQERRIRQEAPRTAQLGPQARQLLDEALAIHEQLRRRAVL
jgi:hypothetical protein